jgi:hypothetical protein
MEGWPASSMTLSAKLAFQFDRRVQMRGQALHLSGAVRVLQASPREFTADVTGTRLYSVELNYRPGWLNIACDCPYFEDTGPCKHVWACILEADRRGSLAEARADAALQVDDVVHLEYAGEEPTALEIPPVLPIRPQQPPLWQEQLDRINQKLVRIRRSAAPWESGVEVRYVVDRLMSEIESVIVLSVESRAPKKNGDWSAWSEMRPSPDQVELLPDVLDRDVLLALLGAHVRPDIHTAIREPLKRFSLPHLLAVNLLPRLARAGRLWMRRQSYGSDASLLAWTEGGPWQLWLRVSQDDRDQWNLEGGLRRGEDRLAFADAELLVSGGFVVTHNQIGLLDDRGGFEWARELKSLKRISFPDREREKALAQLLNTPLLPHLEVDAALRFEERPATARPGLRVIHRRESWGEEYFQARLLLDYGFGWTEAPSPGRGFWRSEERVFVLRDLAAEEAARVLLRELGLRAPVDELGPWRLAKKSMPRTVRELVHRGWHVEAEGKVFRSPGKVRSHLRSGIDWFELHGGVDYDGQEVSLPQLLAAVRRGDGMVVLGDGAFGLLPEEWLSRFAPLVGLGSKEDDHLRFRRNQVGLLDALLAAHEDVRVDENFARLRDRIRSFQGVSVAEQPAGFVGQLRDYQKAGLGWIHFLREYGFGGCLADDMGVGKTAQVLAALEERRLLGVGPSLVVAPRSLMFNWRQEANRFTPGLRVLEHFGLTRDVGALGNYDLVLTTYGTLVRDAAAMMNVEFDYLVLDEAQAVKNSSTATAKAVRLLRGKHRLALSGTPIENHLGELWSLFEFLNPGMLGEAKVLQMSGGLARNPSEEARQILSQALRPFILRRTKQQVARELPEKTEQTIPCELEPAQRKLYDELRKHYRNALLGRVAERGLNKSKMHILEALLRLRQAACHPGLIDETRRGEPSAKLQVLLDQLTELREEGHKALVFSQFTSLLSIVRERLDEAGFVYEYLDGATRNRQEVVERFQTDESCGLFLISLKAGGLGLNLTAAEYVFLLDPWWNPAVEAQAVDRAHRIGQMKPVFAYRLIAKDTVEEKVLELQKSKRDLADAILQQDASILRTLKKEDLEILLS